MEGRILEPQGEEKVKLAVNNYNIMLVNFHYCDSNSQDCFQH